MKEEKVFFYLEDINPLIAEAIEAGGADLGIVVTYRPGGRLKPKLSVSYLKPQVSRLENSTAKDILTNAIDGCPFPPRCS